MHPTGSNYALTWVVDAANVIGARPDGWWRDRAGAAARLHRDILALLGQADGLHTPPDRPARVLVVLEGAARAGVPAGHSLPEFAPPPGGMGETSAAATEDRTAGEAKALLPGKAGEPSELLVIHAPGSGDDSIVDAVRACLPGPTLVVTSDQALRDRVRALGAQVVGSRWLRDALD